MKIPKSDTKCPICFGKITKRNPFVRYHVRYDPPLVIMACKFCNFTEFSLRNNLDLPVCAVINRYPHDILTRADKVLLFHSKLGVPIK